MADNRWSMADDRWPVDELEIFNIQQTMLIDGPPNEY